MIRDTSWPKRKRRLRKIVSELVAHEMRVSGVRRVYVVGSTEIQSTCHESMLGVTSPNLGSALRKVIGSEWRGLGPAMIVANDPAIFGSSSPDEVFNSLLITAVHEAVHWIQFFPKWAVASPLFERSSIVSDTVETDTRSKSVFADILFDPWHGPDFVRLMIHAAWRVHRSTGANLALTRLMDWSGFGYSRPWSYLEAIEDELSLLADKPLSEVKQIAAPAKFTEVWQADLARANEGFA